MFVTFVSLQVGDDAFYQGFSRRVESLGICIRQKSYSRTLMSNGGYIDIIKIRTSRNILSLVTTQSLFDASPVCFRETSLLLIRV